MARFPWKQSGRIKTELLFIPAVLFVLAQLIKTAAQAKPVMAAYPPATFRTAPLCLFLSQEALDAMIFDEFEVFDHTQVIFGTIAMVEIYQPTARKITALVAKPNQTFTQ
jgi:hypothetical protein